MKAGSATVVEMRTLEVEPQRLHPAFARELRRRIRCAQSPADDAGGEVMVTTFPLRWPRITGSTARLTFSGPKKSVSICARNSSSLISRGESLATGLMTGTL